MKGNITRRGKNSWRLKFDVGTDGEGKRKIRYLTVRGKRSDAERQLTHHMHSFHEGTSVDPSKVTVEEHIKAWLANAEVSNKTLERYTQLAEQQIIPHLGPIALQKLRPKDLKDWYKKLMVSGGKGGKPLSARTVAHARRVLHRAIAVACGDDEILSRNVVSLKKSPKVEQKEVEILSASEVSEVLRKLELNNLGKKPHPMLPLVTLALGTGLRRGELFGLQWSDIDFSASTLQVRRSLEETKLGLRLKAPKTKHGYRTIALPLSALDALKAQRSAQREARLELGLGREGASAPVFGTAEGNQCSPDNHSRDWVRLVRSHGLPNVMFHALRHTHASALIAAGVDIVTISRRLGHSSPTVTLTIYAHLFQKTDLTAATAIEATMRARACDP